LVGFLVAQGLDGSAGPADFDFFDGFGIAEAKVDWLVA
jgi:hypothetical protein